MLVCECAVCAVGSAVLRQLVRAVVCQVSDGIMPSWSRLHSGLAVYQVLVWDSGQVRCFWTASVSSVHDWIAATSCRWSVTARFYMFFGNCKHFQCFLAVTAVVDPAGNWMVWQVIWVHDDWLFMFSLPLQLWWWRYLSPTWSNNM